MMPKLILVDDKDNEIGKCEKIEAHALGKLHRAFSIFIINSNNQMLLQKRSRTKYHSPGLWSNACCSHPDMDDLEVFAHRRLKEEMGFDCNIEEIFTFKYNKKFKNNMTENEIDHVLLGKYDGAVNLNKEEAEESRWIGVEELTKDLQENPEDYTYWFKVALPKVLQSLNDHSTTCSSK